MALGSIALSVLAFVSMGLGVLLTPVPGYGAAFAFAAPALALVGIVLGGRALSESRRRGRSEGTALAGVVLSSLCFFPALLTALTCGTCNALCAAGKMQGNIKTTRDFTITLPSYLAPKTLPEPAQDAGIPAFPAAPAPEPPPPPPLPTDSSPDRSPEPSQRPVLPPPPLAPGPRSP